MSKRRREQSQEAPAAAAANKKFPLVIFLTAIVGAVVALGLWNNRPQEEPAPSDARPAKAIAADEPAATSESNSKPGFQKLVGRWVRPDGGYVIQIEGVDDGGKLDAAYFNPDRPNPIPVEKAEAKHTGAQLQAVVVLGGESYAGSTYTLTYEPSADRLQGIYYQAVAGQQFEIFFERMN